MSHIYADYGLPISTQYAHSHIVKGDEKNPLIALASIIAKETRDKIMYKIWQRISNIRFHAAQGVRYKAA